jgi:nickel transport protein
MGRNMLWKVLFLLLAVSLVMQGTAVWAHKVYLYAWVEGKVVHTESYFGGKKKAIGGTITVYDLSGEKLLEGKGDENGEFSFPVPRETDLRIVLDATMGHKAEYLLKAEEFSGAGSAPDQPSAQESHGAGERGPAESVRAGEIRKVLEEVVDEKLKPIARALGEMKREKGPGMTEILGGVGYILGLMGLVAYFRSRKKKGE